MTITNNYIVGLFLEYSIAIHVLLQCCRLSCHLEMRSAQVIFTLSLLTLVASKYDPTWESLDSRPLPPWYDEAKFGIFMHWGVYSVPSFGTEWFWYRWKHDQDPSFVEFMKNNYPPDFEYQDFAPMFHAEFFDPDSWADLLTKSGARWEWTIHDLFYTFNY